LHRLQDPPFEDASQEIVIILKMTPLPQAVLIPASDRQGRIAVNVHPAGRRHHAPGRGNADLVFLEKVRIPREPTAAWKHDARLAARSAPFYDLSGPVPGAGEGLEEGAFLDFGAIRVCSSGKYGCSK
jgi:hypothetical protein